MLHASVYSLKVPLKVGSVRTGGDARLFFRFSKDLVSSSVHRMSPLRFAISLNGLLTSVY